MRQNQSGIPGSIRGVLFDFDGTLADTVSAHTDARREAFNQFGILVSDAIQNEAHRHGSHPPEIIGWILKQVGVIESGADVYSDSVVQSVVKLKNEIYFSKAKSGLIPIPGAIEYLEAASVYYGKEHVGIVTTATREFEVLPFLRKHNLVASVGSIIAKENTPADKLKPNPYAFKVGLGSIGLPPEQVMVVEDSPRGVQAARALSPLLWIAGITTTHNNADLTGGGADIIFDSFDQLRPAIGV